MSTNNFYFKNFLYTVDDSDDIEGFEYEDTKDNILADLGVDEYLASKVLGVQSNQDSDELRSYPSSHIQEYLIGDSKKYDNSICLELVVRSGYYSGYNYDVNIVEYDTWGNFLNVNSKDIEMTEKQRKTLNKVLSHIQKVLELYTTPLKKVGQFSNGEAVYQYLN